jgi:hypothetical protein
MFDVEDGLKFSIHLEVKAPWLAEKDSILLDPGVRSRHSLVTSLPGEATSALFAIKFENPDGESEMDARLIAITNFQPERGRKNLPMRRRKLEEQTALG